MKTLFFLKKTQLEFFCYNEWDYRLFFLSQNDVSSFIQGVKKTYHEKLASILLIYTHSYAPEFKRSYVICQYFLFTFSLKINHTVQLISIQFTRGKVHTKKILLIFIKLNIKESGGVIN